VIVAFLLMATTSSVTLGLTWSNLIDAKDGIEIGDLSLTRLNDVSKSRLFIRLLTNVANGYQSNSY
jgi:hypothetical protein